MSWKNQLRSDSLATQICEINPDESRMSVFNGTYSQMKEERHRIAQLQELENTIVDLESPFVKPAEASKLGIEYQRVQKEMDEKLGEWERMQIMMAGALNSNELSAPFAMIRT